MVTSSNQNYTNLLSMKDTVSLGPVSLHLLLAEMAMVKVVFTCTLLGFSLTVMVVFVHSPHAVVMFAISDVEDTLIS